MFFLINLMKPLFILNLGEQLTGLDSEAAARKLRGRVGTTVRVKLLTVMSLYLCFPSSCDLVDNEIFIARQLRGPIHIRANGLSGHLYLFMQHLNDYAIHSQGLFLKLLSTQWSVVCLLKYHHLHYLCCSNIM